VELQVGYSPTPLVFISGDSRGFTGPVSSLESIALKPIGSKGVGG
jgi:hypothetical protein